MYLVRPTLLPVCWSALILTAAACGPVAFEGQYEGDCDDGIDNDGDALVDCDDPSCQGSLLCESGDDDDSTEADDDDTIHLGDDDTDPSSVTIGGDIEAGVYGNGPTLNSVISELANPDNTMTTDAQGLWSLRLPRDPAVALNAAVPGYIDGRLYLNLSSPTQRSRDDQHFTVLSEEEIEMFALFLSAPYDPTKAQLFVWADRTAQGSVADAIVTVDRPHDGSFQLTGKEPTMTDRLDDKTPLFFLNLEPGDLTMTATLANGVACEAAVPLPLEPTLISTAYFSCP